MMLIRGYPICIYVVERKWMYEVFQSHLLEEDVVSRFPIVNGFEAEVAGIAVVAVGGSNCYNLHAPNSSFKATHRRYGVRADYFIGFRKLGQLVRFCCGFKGFQK